MGKHFSFPSGKRIFHEGYVSRFCSGAHLAMLSNPIMGMGEIGNVGRRTGMFRTIAGVGALAEPPISGAIKSATGDFKAVGYHACVPLNSSVVFFVGIHFIIFQELLSSWALI
jgi:hypothetical protein